MPEKCQRDWCDIGSILEEHNQHEAPENVPVPSQITEVWKEKLIHGYKWKNLGLFQVHIENKNRILLAQ